MKITCISDTHHIVKEARALLDLTTKLPGREVLVHAGDMSSRGTVDEIRLFLLWFSRLPYTHKILVAGNHDWLFERNPEEAEKLLAEFPGVTYLNDSGVTIEGLKFWGSPVQPTFHNWAFNRNPEKIRKHWDMIPEDTDVLITHGPPLGILDTIEHHRPGAGCPLLRDAVLRVKPKLHVFGHIHEGRGIRRVDETLYVNAAVLNGKYELYNHDRIEIDL